MIVNSTGLTGPSGLRPPEKEAAMSKIFGTRKGDQPPRFGNSHFEQISCQYAEGNIIRIDGLEDQPVEDLYFERINLQGEQGILVANARNVTFKDLRIRVRQHPAINIDGGVGINFDGQTVIGKE